MTNQTVRPTKKQRELLSYIQEFIREHGYSPSYREIMNGLDYTSVATVSLHINSLIRRGHLRKRGRSARSLEVVESGGEAAVVVVQPAGETAWLTGRVEQVFAEAEAAENCDAGRLQQLQTLVASLRILGLPEAAESFDGRLQSLAVTGGDSR